MVYANIWLKSNQRWTDEPTGDVDPILLNRLKSDRLNNIGKGIQSKTDINIFSFPIPLLMNSLVKPSLARTK